MTNVLNKCIVFTDIKRSSLLWDKFKTQMAKALETHFDNVKTKVNNQGGMIIKTIGDAHMIAFDDLEKGIKFAINMCYENIDIPTNKNILSFKSNDTIDEKDMQTLQIRIGMCYGPVESKKLEIQNCNDLIDYFGSTVNLASRMESKVSKVGSFALCISPSGNEDEEVNNFTNEINTVMGVLENVCKPCTNDNISDCKCSVNFILYHKSKGCNRSGRLLSPECYNLDSLNSGNKEVLAFRITPKLV